MSITATNYFINNSGSYVDLSNVFFINYPVSGTPATGYTTVDFPNTDLADIFEAQTTEPSIYITTNYIVENYTPLWSSSPGNYDLGQIFIPNNSYFFTTTGNPTITSGNIDISGNTTGPWSYIIVFNSTGTFQPVNENITNVNYIVVGAGGGGAGTYSISPVYTFGGGGGGGQIVTGNFNPTTGNSYTIGVGIGGTAGNGGSSASPGGQGGFSVLADSVTSPLNVNAAGGYGGYLGTIQGGTLFTGGTGGNSGNNTTTGGQGTPSSAVGGGGGGYAGNGSIGQYGGGAGGAGYSIQISTLTNIYSAGGNGGPYGTSPNSNTGCGGGGASYDSGSSPGYAGSDGVVILYF